MKQVLLLKVTWSEMRCKREWSNLNCGARLYNDGRATPHGKQLSTGNQHLGRHLCVAASLSADKACMKFDPETAEYMQSVVNNRMSSA